MIFCCPFVRSIKNFFCNTLSRLAQFICVRNSTVSTPKFNTNSRGSKNGFSTLQNAPPPTAIQVQVQVQVQAQAPSTPPTPTPTEINSGQAVLAQSKPELTPNKVTPQEKESTTSNSLQNHKTSFEEQIKDLEFRLAELRKGAAPSTKTNSGDGQAVLAQSKPELTPNKVIPQEKESTTSNSVPNQKPTDSTGKPQTTLEEGQVQEQEQELPPPPPEIQLQAEKQELPLPGTATGTPPPPMPGTAPPPMPGTATGINSGVNAAILEGIKTERKRKAVRKKESTTSNSENNHPLEEKLFERRQGIGNSDSDSEEFRVQNHKPIESTEKPQTTLAEGQKKSTESAPGPGTPPPPPTSLTTKDMEQPKKRPPVSPSRNETNLDFLQKIQEGVALRKVKVEKKPTQSSPPTGTPTVLDIIKNNPMLNSDDFKNPVPVPVRDTDTDTDSDWGDE